MRKWLIAIWLLWASSASAQLNFRDPYDTEVMSDSPVAYWRLNDTVPNGGPALDISGNGHTGTYGSATGQTLDMKEPPAFSTCGWAKRNNDSNGTQQNITVPDDAAFDLGTGNFSIEFLWKQSNLFTTLGCSTNGTLISKGTDTGGFPYIRCQNSGPGVQVELVFQMCSDAYTILVANGAFRQVVFVRTSTTNVKSYVNGSFQADRTVNSSCSLTNASDLKIWYNSTIGGGDTSTYEASLDNISFYNTALDATAISDHYTALSQSVPCPQMPDTQYDVRREIDDLTLFALLRPVRLR